MTFFHSYMVKIKKCIFCKENDGLNDHCFHNVTQCAVAAGGPSVDLHFGLEVMNIYFCKKS